MGEGKNRREEDDTGEEVDMNDMHDIKEEIDEWRWRPDRLRYLLLRWNPKSGGSKFLITYAWRLKICAFGRSGHQPRSVISKERTGWPPPSIRPCWASWPISCQS